MSVHLSVFYYYCMFSFYQSLWGFCLASTQVQVLKKKEINATVKESNVSKRISVLEVIVYGMNDQN